MKKITLLLLLLTCTLVFAQSPTTSAPTPPARGSGDVISIYGGDDNSYTNITGTDYAPYWSQPTPPWVAPNPAFDAGGNNALEYQALNYQGLTFGGNPQNVSSMQFLHIDIWTNSVSPNINVLSGNGDQPYNIASGAGWQSIDIPMSNFTLPNLANIVEFKFDGGNSVDNIYIDNLYFYKVPTDPMEDTSLSDLTVGGTTIDGFGASTTNYTFNLPAGTTVAPSVGATTTNVGASANITQAPGVPGDATIEVTAADGTTMQTYTVSFVALGPSVAAPTPPARATADVISFFSDAYTSSVGSLVYTDNGGTNTNTYNTNWCGANTELVMVGGNDTNKIVGLGCEGIDWQGSRTLDASGMTNFHIDFYTDETDFVGKVFTMKFSQWTDDNAANNPDNQERSALLLNLEGVSTPDKPAIQTGWNSVDVVIDNAFTGNLRRDDIVQFIISSNLTGDVWYDNVYLYKGVPLSNDDFNKTSFTAFPNPTQDSWTVKGQDAKIETINVFDILGKEVLRLSPNNNEARIDGSSLKSGIYFAHIKTLSGINSVKLIKQ